MVNIESWQRLRLLALAIGLDMCTPCPQLVLGDRISGIAAVDLGVVALRGEGQVTDRHARGGDSDRRLRLRWRCAHAPPPRYQWMDVALLCIILTLNCSLQGPRLLYKMCALGCVNAAGKDGSGG